MDAVVFRATVFAQEGFLHQGAQADGFRYAVAPDTQGGCAADRPGVPHFPARTFLESHRPGRRLVIHCGPAQDYDEIITG